MTNEEREKAATDLLAKLGIGADNARDICRALDVKLALVDIYYAGVEDGISRLDRRLRAEREESHG